MRKMNVAVGCLVLLGFVLIMSGVIQKVAGLNLLEPLINASGAAFMAANTCFLLAIVLDRFDSHE